MLNWDVILPTSFDFLRHNLQYAALYSGQVSYARLPSMLYESREERSAKTVMHQRYDTLVFARAAAILDQAMLDYDSLAIVGSVLAAAVFWLVYLENGSVADSEKILIITSGYQRAALSAALDFLQPYSLYTEQDVLKSLDTEEMTNLVQTCTVDSMHFRLEEHQTPVEMTVMEVDEIMAARSAKKGMPYSLSYWEFEDEAEEQN